MNARTQALALAIAAMTGVLVQGQSFTWPISVMVERQLDLSPNPYNVWISSSPLWFDGGTAVAPDGTVFQSDPISGTVVIAGLTAADLTSRFAGVWTLNDLHQVPPGDQPQQHQFTVTSSALTGGFPSTPAITSPLPGAIVPRTFDVFTTGGGGLKIFGGSAQFQNLGPTHTTVSLKFLPGVQQMPLGLRAHATSYTDLPLATSLSPSPVRRYDPSVGHRSMSPETLITVLNVPEPSAYFLVSAATFTLGAISRRAGPSRAMPAT